jgi:outer membrane protein insertion porin family
MVLRNVFGNAETFSAKSSYGIENSQGSHLSNSKGVGFDGASALQVSLSKPLHGNPDTTLEVAAHKSEKNHSKNLGINETSRGISVVHNLSQHDSNYKVGCEANWRENHSVTDDASLPSRLNAGNSLKASVFHEFTLDNRNDVVFPSKGRYLKFFQELSGLGGNVRHLKNEMNFSTSGGLSRLVSGFNVRWWHLPQGWAVWSRCHRTRNTDHVSMIDFFWEGRIRFVDFSLEVLARDRMVSSF